MNNIYFNNKTRGKIDSEKVVFAVSQILEKLNADSYTISISAVSAPVIKNLNKQYRGINTTTDIITFCLDDGESFKGFKQDKNRTADMYLCPKFIKKNALRFDTTFKTEFLRLLIHGTLHAVGYEHSTEFRSDDYESVEMFKIQEEFLSFLLSLSNLNDIVSLF